MLHAFRHEWPATWDHFDGGTIYAAWIEIQNFVADLGDELYFNDLAHYEKRPELEEYQRPWYLYLDNFNTYELSTRLGAFDSEWSEVHPDIRKCRYGAAGYCWWKVLHKKALYVRSFNEELAKIWQATYPEKPSYQSLFVAACEAWEVSGAGQEIEGKPFDDWFLEQPILRNDAWAENSCAVSVYKDKGYIFNYRRDNFWTGGGWQEREIPNNCTDPGCFVRVTKTRWNGHTVVQEFTNLDHGYKEWNITINDDEGMLRFKAEHFINGNPHISSTAYAVDTAEAYETDEIFGVVTDAVGGEGAVSVTKDGAPIGTYPVDKYVFKIPNQGGGLEDGAGEYDIMYTPGGVRGASAGAAIEKDGGCFFDARAYLSDATPGADVNQNGIPDDDEQALAEKFVPEIRLHHENYLVPQNVGIYLDSGRGPLVKYVFYENPETGRRQLLNRVAYWPTEAHPMEMIFEETKPWPKDYFQEWALVFGPDYDGLDASEYWHTNYDDLALQGYNEATIYYNIFKHCGKPVIQYWFFYPFNDWANEHEGDWEHINVKITSPHLDRAGIYEVLYYFHYNFKVVPGDLVPLANGTTTHPIVYVGGRADVFFDEGPTSYWGDNSGGSYWRTGKFVDVGKGLGHSVDEWIDEPLHVVHWYHFTDPQHHLERLVRNDRVANHYWAEFPWGWGRHPFEIHFGMIQSEAPPSPMLHECWEVYRHPGYWEYGFDRSTAPAPPLAGAGDPAPPSDAEPFGPPIAAYAPSPTAGDYISPTVGDRPSPVALTPEGGGVDVPGADLPPTDAPVLTSPTNSGGDWLSTGAAAAPLERRGPLAAATPAASLACSPNPVTATATISFKLETPSRVYLAVYDLSGRRVATLAEGPYGAGNHAAYWQANVPTGVYIYRLQAGDRVAVKKVVVAK